MQQYYTGALKNEPDNRDIDYTRLASTTSLPKEHITDISMIPVLNQSMLGTCVSHAITTMKMYQEYKETSKIFPFSRRYHYALSRKDFNYFGEGLYPRLAAKTVFEKGMREPDDIDDNTLQHAIYEAYVPTVDEIVKAKPFGVKGYAFVPTVLSEIKKAIVNEGVITASLSVQLSKWNPIDGFIQKPDVVESAHYIALYGYKDTENDTIFYARNSWGESYGNKGNFMFKWSDYQNYIYDIIAFTDIPKEVIEEAKNTQYIFTQTLKMGMRGTEVKKLQERLKEDGYFKYHTCTGLFGSVTRLAVMAFQKANGLVADGVVGSRSRAVLNNLKKKPSVTITRELSDTIQTTGKLMAYKDDKKFVCDTLELGWNNNMRNISCIPKGTYKVKRTFSPKFMKYTYEILNVPNRSGIRIHSVNFYWQLLGCIALGKHTHMDGDGRLDTSASRLTIKAFEDFMKGETFDLVIK